MTAICWFANRIWVEDMIWEKALVFFGSETMNHFALKIYVCSCWCVWKTEAKPTRKRRASIGKALGAEEATVAVTTPNCGCGKRYIYAPDWRSCCKCLEPWWLWKIMRLVLLSNTLGTISSTPSSFQPLPLLLLENSPTIANLLFEEIHKYFRCKNLQLRLAPHEPDFANEASTKPNDIWSFRDWPSSGLHTENFCKCGGLLSMERSIWDTHMKNGTNDASTVVQDVWSNPNFTGCILKRMAPGPPTLPSLNKCQGQPGFE